MNYARFFSVLGALFFASCSNDENEMSQRSVGETPNSEVTNEQNLADSGSAAAQNSSVLNVSGEISGYTGSGDSIFYQPGRTAPDAERTVLTGLNSELSKTWAGSPRPDQPETWEACNDSRQTYGKVINSGRLFGGGGLADALFYVSGSAAPGTVVGVIEIKNVDFIANETTQFTREIAASEVGLDRVSVIKLDNIRSALTPTTDTTFTVRILDGFSLAVHRVIVVKKASVREDLWKTLYPAQADYAKWHQTGKAGADGQSWVANRYEFGIGRNFNKYLSYGPYETLPTPEAFALKYKIKYTIGDTDPEPRSFEFDKPIGEKIPTVLFTMYSVDEDKALFRRQENLRTFNSLNSLPVKTLYWETPYVAPKSRSNRYEAWVYIQNSVSLIHHWTEVWVLSDVPTPGKIAAVEALDLFEDPSLIPGYEKKSLQIASGKVTKSLHTSPGTTLCRTPAYFVGTLNVPATATSASEFTANSTNPTHVVGSGNLTTVRNWIGSSSGMKTTQRLQFDNIPYGHLVELKIHPQNVSDSSSYTASIFQGSASIDSGARFSTTQNGYFQTPNPWKIQFTAKTSTVVIELSNSQTSGTHFMYINAYESAVTKPPVAYMIGTLDVPSSASSSGEFTNTGLTPTFVAGRSGLGDVRNWIGFASGSRKAQRLQFDNLKSGSIITLKVHPQNVNDGSAYAAIVAQGSGTIESGSSYATSFAGYFTTPSPWIVQIRALSPSLVIELGNTQTSGAHFMYVNAYEAEIR